MVPKPVKICCSVLREAGYEAYPVGGCVRDLLLGRTPDDWDVCTSALPEQVTALFRRVLPTGIQHGTVMVLMGGLGIEVTTFRREEGYTDGRHPDEVEFVSDLACDLARRDFTVNAMALEDGNTVIDLFGGMADLRRRVLRTVKDPVESFREDGLRMLRCVRQSTQLDFDIDPATREAIRLCAPELQGVSAERMRMELEKSIRSKTPERMAQFFELGLLPGYRTPDLRGMNRVENEPLYRWAFLCSRVENGPELLAEMKLARKTLEQCEQVRAILQSGTPDWSEMLSRYGRRACETAATVLGGGEPAKLAACAEAQKPPVRRRRRRRRSHRSGAAVPTGTAEE